jgi:serine O-acetyltransferase
MFEKIRSDFKAVFDRDPAATKTSTVILTYSGFHAIVLYRLAHWFREKDVPLLPPLISYLARFMTGVEIHPSAKIGKGFFIDHGMGVVIGETTEIGENVTLFQSVTLGGTGKERGKRHPTIGHHVMIGAGAKVFGPITVGDHVKIGANAVVLESVPPNSTVVGIPGKVVKLDGRRVQDEAMLDHRRMPDPTAERIEALERELEHLRQQVMENEAQSSKEPKNNA